MMSKEKIVKYTSEELKKLQDESDWERAARMTEEEIEAADAQDLEVAGIDDAWMDQAEVVRPPKKGVYAVFDEYVIEYFKKSGAAIGAG
jgi:hypothetical protein